MTGNKDTFTIENLNALASRLSDHADAVLARKDAERDMRMAAVACHRLATMRYRITEIGRKALENPQWDSAAISRDINELLEEVAKEEGT